jgi:hypothetical protein
LPGVKLPVFAHGEAGGRGKIRIVHHAAAASSSNPAIGNSDFNLPGRIAFSMMLRD